MNKKVIKGIAILSMIITVSLAFKNAIKSVTKKSAVSATINKKILNVKEAAVAAIDPRNSFANFMVKGFYKSSAIKGNALIVTLSSTIKDSGDVQVLPCLFFNNAIPQLNDIPANAEIVLTGNPLTLENIPQMGDCKLISINMPDLTAQF